VKLIDFLGRPTGSDFESAGEGLTRWGVALSVAALTVLMCVWVFQTGAGVEEDDAFTGIYPTLPQ